MSGTRQQKKAPSKSNRVLSFVGILLCIVFGFVLVCNLVIIIKSNLAPDEPPSVLGIAPFTVLSGSMSGDREGHLEIGDLIFVQKVEASELKEGDVISFVVKSSVTTHRIVKITETDGERQFITKGDANNAEDQEPVSEDQLVGRYLWRIPKIGNFALFLREPMGMVLFIVVPLMLFVFIDVFARRRLEETQRGNKQSQLALENARLRAMLEERETTPKLPEPTAAETPTAPPIIAAAPVVEAPPVYDAPQPVPAPQPMSVPPIVVQAPPSAPVPPPASAPVVVAPPPAELKKEEYGGFYIGEPPKADKELLSAIYDGREAAPPVMEEQPKPQEPEEASLEEILAFARNLEANRKK